MQIAASIIVQEYVCFLLSVFLMFGILFEPPVIPVLLTQLGLIKPQWLIKTRTVMYVVIFKGLSH